MKPSYLGLSFSSYTTQKGKKEKGKNHAKKCTNEKMHKFEFKNIQTV